MPANLTPQYHDAEERFKRAATTEERLDALQEMLRVIPKHKGTEKMQAELRRKLSRLRQEGEQKKAASSSKSPFYYVPREGAGRVAVCGPANSGKSQLVGCLTAARTEVADYPFTTRAPIPGMMLFEDIQIQLIDTPPLEEHTLEPWQLALIEQSDLIVLLFDVNAPELLDQTEFVLGELEKRGLRVDDQGHPPLLILGNKVDLPEGMDNFSAWKELYRGRFNPQPFSTVSGAYLEEFGQEVFTRLDIVRVYTRPPGGRADRDSTPYVLARGSTVLDAAETIHKELAQRFQYARVWGQARFDGQMVEKDYELEDGDCIEIHAG
ncbi:MAG TPA: TGS domain-containing protein [Acidobacteriota bacterium]|nr:TGS domain-containing protein [Acidobacteriota bacterium]